MWIFKVQLDFVILCISAFSKLTFDAMSQCQQRYFLQHSSTNWYIKINSGTNVITTEICHDLTRTCVVLDVCDTWRMCYLSWLLLLHNAKLLGCIYQLHDSKLSSCVYQLHNSKSLLHTICYTIWKFCVIIKNPFAKSKCVFLP